MRVYDLRYMRDGVENIIWCRNTLLRLRGTDVNKNRQYILILLICAHEKNVFNLMYTKIEPVLYQDCLHPSLCIHALCSIC